MSIASYVPVGSWKPDVRLQALYKFIIDRIPKFPQRSLVDTRILDLPVSSSAAKAGAMAEQHRAEESNNQRTKSGSSKRVVV